MIWKLFKVTSESGESPFSHVSVKHMRRHSQYSLCSRVSAISSSILSGRELAFPLMTVNMVYTIFSSPDASLQLRSLFSSSAFAGGISAFSTQRSHAWHRTNSFGAPAEVFKSLINSSVQTASVTNWPSMVHYLKQQKHKVKKWYKHTKALARQSKRESCCYWLPILRHHLGAWCFPKVVSVSFNVCSSLNLSDKFGFA